jgi:hypothetical protein
MKVTLLGSCFGLVEMNAATCLMDPSFSTRSRRARQGQVFVRKFSYNESPLGSSDGKYASVNDDATVG